jgi:hypothetical protein
MSLESRFGTANGEARLKRAGRLHWRAQPAPNELCIIPALSQFNPKEDFRRADMLDDFMHRLKGYALHLEGAPTADGVNFFRQARLNIQVA